MKNVKWRSVASHKDEVFDILKDAKTVCVFDTETTGLEPDAKIIQFSAIKYEISPEHKITPLASVNTYVNPEMILPDVITEITGITQETVDKAENENFKVKEIMGILDSSDVWVGQNVNFDIMKIDNMCKRTDYPYTEKPHIDVLTMARHLIPNDEIAPTAKKLGFSKANHKLATITTYLFPNYTAKYHDSMEDVQATAVCFEKLLEMYKSVKAEKDNLERIVPKYAFFWINPNKQTDQRIKICLPDNNKTAIYYDAMDHYWTCYSTKADKDRFDNLDKSFIEKCVLNRYGAKYEGITCMEDLARCMRKDYIEKNKTKVEDLSSYFGPKTPSTPPSVKTPDNKPEAENDAEIDLW